MTKSGIAVAAAFALVALALGHSVSASAPPSDRRTRVQTRQLTPGLFAQGQTSVRRPRTRITVRPSIPATGIYPSPLPYAYPGPNAVRDCTSWLATEYRPSGTVIVPRMRCWWTVQ
jgi:hypothetical protein